MLYSTATVLLSELYSTITGIKLPVFQIDGVDFHKPNRYLRLDYSRFLPNLLVVISSFDNLRQMTFPFEEDDIYKN